MEQNAYWPSSALNNDVHALVSSNYTAMRDISEFSSQHERGAKNMVKKIEEIYLDIFGDYYHYKKYIYLWPIFKQIVQLVSIFIRVT